MRWLLAIAIVTSIGCQGFHRFTLKAIGASSWRLDDHPLEISIVEESGDTLQVRLGETDVRFSRFR